MTKSEKNQIHRAIHDSYLDRVTDKAAHRYLANKAELAREIKRINIETGIICAGLIVLFTLLILGIK
tara:strand:+ start:177 stop:377 length:201 start_codon:yes stop_codon:yes gene_type:complete